MKNLKLMAAFVALVLISAPSFAASSSQSVPASASVDGSLSMDILIKKNSTAGAVITSMAFGQLQADSVNWPGTLRSSATGPGNTGTGNATVIITPNSHGLPYTVTQTGTALSNGSTTIPAGACTVVPVYSSADNGGSAKPAAAVLGNAGTWVATNKALYTSESGSAQQRTIQAIYSITDDPGAGATAAVPLAQAGGTYNGTITFTVTA